MPPGTPFHGFIPPFPIRVDEFVSTPDLTSVPALYLLSHTHTDHILGLSAKSFASTTICSPDAKEMLLRHEPYGERAMKDTDLRDEVRASKTFAHLKVPPLFNDDRLDYSASRDLLRTLPLHTPTKIELCNNSTITLTLFDANHCPGAVMFLVEGDQGAVLHTGDFRAEPWFLDYIRRNPFLQPYLAPPKAQDGGQLDEKCSGTPLSKTLDSIYLDTASVLSTMEVPPKSDATQGLVSLMALFPRQTTFFINAWTWGYEDILRAVAHSFQSQIHVDRYKHTIYSHVADPFLHSVITLDPSKTRFHACERFNRCPHASGVDVVYINPVTMGKVKWEQYCALTESKLRAAQPVSVLLVPLSRHSPLQELRAFVSLFRPARVVPNTLYPSFHGLDELCIPHLFADCLSSPPSSLSVSTDMEKGEMEMDEDCNDAAIQNLIGDGADNIARVWADTGRSIDKLAVIEPFLRDKTRDVVRRTLGLSPLLHETYNGDERAVSAIQRIRDAQRIQACLNSGGESDQETGSDDDDAHMRTAKALFGITGMSQVVGPQGEERMQTSQSRCPLVEERNRKDTHHIREVAFGNSSFASLHTQPLRGVQVDRASDFELSSSFHLTASESPVLSLDPPGSRATQRNDVALMDVQNIPSHSLSQSASWPASPSSMHPHLSRPAAKRRQVEGWPSALSEDNVPKPVRVSSREEFSAQKAGTVHANAKSGADSETRRIRRRTLRTRSRLIEEKLRCALPMPEAQ